MREATQDELEILRRLHQEIVARSPRNSLRSRFVDAEESLRERGFTIPPGMENFQVALNWPAKAVSSFAARQVPTGFTTRTASTLLDDIKDVYADNNFYAVERWAIESADEHGCSFVFTSRGDTSKGEPEFVLSARTALTATAEVDERTRRVKAAMEMVGGSRVILHLPGRVLKCIRRPGTWWVEGERPQRTGGRVLCAPFVHGGSLRRPLGRSRITQVVMDLTYAASRTLLRQEVAAEFFQAPRLALMGADKSVFTDPVTGKELSPMEILTGAIWAVPDIHPDDEPDVDDRLRRAGFEQISQMSFQPYNDQFRLLAGATSSATSLPAYYLGVMQDSNPTSAQAIEASEIDLVREVRAQNPSLGHGRRELGLNILAAIHGPLNEDERAEIRSLTAEWEDPRTRSMSEQSQMTALQVQAGNLQPGTRTTVKQLPLSLSDIDAAVAENERAAGEGLLSSLLNGGTADSEDAPSLAERANTFGILIRSGATPESAARVAGLEGVDMRPGAAPVTLRDSES